MPVTLLGLRTVIHPAPDLAAATSWWTDLLGFPHYFQEPFYLGFAVAGYGLGLLPDAEAGLGAPPLGGGREACRGGVAPRRGSATDGGAGAWVRPASPAAIPARSPSRRSGGRPGPTGTTTAARQR